MNASSLIGIWRGEYVLGPSYGEELDGSSASFILFIENTFNNSFKGKCVDLEGEVGVDDYQPCTIEGFVEVDLISFIKKYPYATYYDEENQAIEDKEQEGQVVHYEGRFNKSIDSFEGEWEIEMILESMPDEYIMNVYKGRWFMKRDD